MSHVRDPEGRVAKKIKYIPFFLLASSVFIGCGKSANPPIVSIKSPNPCAMALTPQVGDSKADREIARLQQKARESANALPYLERVGWLFVGKARESFDPGYYKLAEQCAVCMESKKPDSLEAMLLRGHVLHSLHRFKDSEVLARELVAKRGLAFDYGLLGDVLMEQGKLTEAVEAYQKMMDQKPSPEAYSRVAHIRWLKGDLSGAIEAMQMAADASGSGAPESAAWFRTRLALYELQAGDFEKSSALITAALTLQPDYPPALLARGRWLLAQDKAADAIEPLERAAQLNPLPEYHWVLLEALRATGSKEEITRVGRLLQQRGAADDPRTYALYLATSKQDSAIARQLAHDELNTRADVFTLDAVAWAEEAAGQTSKAREFSKLALQEGTEDGRLFLHAAVIAQAAGDREEATRLFARASALKQMLLPSEKEILTTLQNDKTDIVSLQSH
jgi:tetratricopeptide (TPR) repeat protein